MNRIINILKSSSMFFVSDQNCFIYTKIPPFQMPSNQISSTVRRFIINYDHSIICILLLKNRLQMPSISIVHLIIICWYHNTSMYLLFRLIDSVDSLVILSFSLINISQLRNFRIVSFLEISTS